MSYKALSERLEQLGRPIAVLGLRRIEAGERRVDVDDLVALALAFDVGPATLLLPREETHDPVAMTGKGDTAMGWQAAWRWSVGEWPAFPGRQNVDLCGPRMLPHLRANRPFERSPASEAGQALLTRVGPGFTAEFEHDPTTGRVRGNVSITAYADGEGADDGR